MAVKKKRSGLDDVRWQRVRVLLSGWATEVGELDPLLLEEIVGLYMEAEKPEASTLRRMFEKIEEILLYGHLS